MKRKSLTLIVLSTWLVFNYAAGKTPDQNTKNPYAVATFECAGLYWKKQDNGVCKIRYKEVGKDHWKEGLDLVYDLRDGEYRGRIKRLGDRTSFRSAGNNV